MTAMWQVRMKAGGDRSDARVVSVAAYPGFESVLAQMTGGDQALSTGIIANGDGHGYVVRVRVQAADALHAGIEAARIVDRASAVCGVPHWPVTALEVTAD